MGLSIPPLRPVHAPGRIKRALHLAIGLRTRPRLLRWMHKATAAVALLGLSACGIFQGLVHFMPYRGQSTATDPPAVMIEDRYGQPMAAFVAADDQWRLPLSLKDMGPHLPKAIVAVEDGRFLEHAGVDWRSMSMAVAENTLHLGNRRGASTITMQLQRLRSDTPRTITGKFWQMVGSEQIELHESKEQILTEYLNAAPFGGNLVGVGAASWRYFGKPPSQLSLGQAALLAGLPQNPNGYRPDRFPAAAMERRQHVLDRMLSCQMITPEEHRLASHEPMDARWRPLPQVAARSAMLPALLTISQRSPGGMVRSSLDQAIQQQCDQVAWRMLNQVHDPEMAVCIVVMDTQTSEILASTSASTQSALIHLAEQPRSTGSILKPFIYATAFADNRCKPTTVLADLPASWAGYSPANYDHDYRGPVAASDALAQSRNLPALNLLNLVGTQRAIGVMAGCGFQTLAGKGRTYGLSLAIGGAEATPIEVAEAFATLARGGRHLPARWTPITSPNQSIPNQIASIDDLKPSHQLLLTNSAPTQAAHATPSILPADACWQTLAALCRSNPALPTEWNTHPTGFAWKTGTSSNHRDAWCAAVSSRRTVVVWIGNPQGRGQAQWNGLESTSPAALSLLASLDPYPRAWPSASTEPANELPPVLMPRPKLAITSPTASTTYLIDDSQSTDTCRIPLKCTWTAISTEHPINRQDKVWWFVDGKCLGAVPADQTLWWNAEPGTHNVRVMNAESSVALIQIAVEKP